MLQSLHIRNFAIIEDVTLELGSGLNILSGETGAGKSIIIQALGLLMGERGNSDWIRKGEGAAVVAGLFVIGDQKNLLRKLDEWGVPLEDCELLIQRTLSRNGRNQVRVNGMPATVAMLSELAESLVDIVSQREHERLLQPDVQRELLDEFGGTHDLLSEYRDKFETLRVLKKDIEELEQSVEHNREMEEFLRFQLREIREANLQSGEDERLRTEKGRIKNAAQLGELCTMADDMLVSGGNTVGGRLAKLENQLARVADADLDLAKLLPILQSIQVQLDDCAQTFSNSLSDLQFEPGRLEAIESRLAEIDRLKKKYGATIDAVLAHAQEVDTKLRSLENYDEKVEEISREIEVVGKKLLEAEKKLQSLRDKAGKKLASQVMRELSDLDMGEASFGVCWEPLSSNLLEFGGQKFDRYGLKRSVFQLMANPGEDPKPLVRIASGGERSRILLALKKILVDFSDLGTSVYDEVDEGVGGATASKIGEKLAEIAQKRQVICITHQPQIAAYADRHFVVMKEFEKSRTRASVCMLDDKERELEIARMLAGKEVTMQARKHAREMIRGITP